MQTVLADIGDEQSIAQSPVDVLRPYGEHCRHPAAVQTHSSLVLFDELGAGTDPVEGAALAIAIIEYCRQAGCRVAATTHYAELKLYAMTHARRGQRLLRV